MQKPHLLIVESPAKARTMKRFLGNAFRIEASMGHVRDLPETVLGVDPEKHFAPKYVIPEEKQAVVKKLRAAFKGAEDLWIATDEDREGEAIGWHITEVLKLEDPQDAKRIVFHEITQPAIEEAVQHPRSLDMRLVDAQQARRILDRLVGYTLSPFLWKKVMRGLSAGRVQSVAVRIIVDREREVQAFEAQEYWTVASHLRTDTGEEFQAYLRERGGKSFVPKTSGEAQTVLTDVQGAPFGVSSLTEKELHRQPPPPFTTSTLQQEAGKKLGFSVKQTMVIAQQLYEGINLGRGDGHHGLITYMRTDSVIMSAKALEDAKNVIAKIYGREYVLTTPRRYKTKAKGAQEAHEAIRPTELERTPASLKDVLDHQQLKLYTLIWNRTLATQMPTAQFRRISADITVASPQTDLLYTFRATGQTVLFDGYLRVYAEEKEEHEESNGEEGILPPLKEGQPLSCLDLVSEQHFTKPPPRYTEAALVKKLEEEGIGRPSTYAPTISTIQQRGYIRKDGRQLVPEDMAFTVTDLLKEHFPDIIDLSFTATMEESLDDIARGKKKHVVFLQDFFGPFSRLVSEKTKVLRREDILQERTLGEDPTSGLPVLLRHGRFGPYVQLGEVPKEKYKEAKPKTASLPKGVRPEDMDLAHALALLRFPKTLGIHEGAEVSIFLGRYGPYVRWGKVSVSLPSSLEPQNVGFEQAVSLLQEAISKRQHAKEPLRTLGKDSASGGTIVVKDGRYGPYVTDGTTNASLGKKHDPMAITMEEAEELLRLKRTRGPRRRWPRRQAQSKF